MVTGILTYAGDSNSLAWGLLEVLRNPDLANRLSQEAYKRVHEVYNWRAIAKRTSEAYEKVMAEASLIGAEGVASTPASTVSASNVASTAKRDQVTGRAGEKR
jgi:hypothetical protein